MLRFEILFQASCNKATVAGRVSYFDHPRHPSIMNEWRPMPNRKDPASTIYLRGARPVSTAATSSEMVAVIRRLFRRQTKQKAYRAFLHVARCAAC